MSNQTNTANIARAFKATFIAANNGLQTEQRVHGRRAFQQRQRVFVLEADAGQRVHRGRPSSSGLLFLELGQLAVAGG